MIHARSFSAVSALILALSVTAGPVSADPAPVCQTPEVDAAAVAAARALLAEVPLVDGHNDLPWALRAGFENRLHDVDLGRDLSAEEDPDHTDVPRLEAGGVGGQFWSVYVPVSLPPAEAVQAVVEQIDVVHRLIELYPETFELALTADDVERIHRAGRIASLIGIEGGHSIGRSLGVLRQLYRVGARYMTITHWQNTAWADSATDEPEFDGLAPFGEAVIREMNRLGMLVDLSHVSEATMHDVLDLATAPVIFSHSSARGATAHPRNVPDSVLDRLADNGGVVMVTFVPSFINEQVRQRWAAREGEKARLESLHIGDPEGAAAALERWEEDNPVIQSTLADVADHIDYLNARVGVAHIGIGGDYDGISSVPSGLEDVSCYPALLAELSRRGYTRDELVAIVGGNVLRALRGAEAAAARLADEPSSDALFEAAGETGEDA